MKSRNCSCNRCVRSFSRTHRHAMKLVLLLLFASLSACLLCSNLNSSCFDCVSAGCDWYGGRCVASNVLQSSCATRSITVDDCCRAFVDCLTCHLAQNNDRCAWNDIDGCVVSSGTQLSCGPKISISISRSSTTKTSTAVTAKPPIPTTTSVKLPPAATTSPPTGSKTTTTITTISTTITTVTTTTAGTISTTTKSTVPTTAAKSTTAESTTISSRVTTASSSDCRAGTCDDCRLARCSWCSYPTRDSVCVSGTCDDNAKPIIDCTGMCVGGFILLCFY
jgi:hypothetical protein